MKEKFASKKLTCSILYGVLPCVLLTLLMVLTAAGGAKPQPGNSSSFGKSLAEWQELYQRWQFGDISVATDEKGNAVIGHVVLLAVPPTPGDGTPGTQDIRLLPGEAFVLPFWGELGTAYNDGTPPDEFIDIGLFQTLELKVTLDGVTIVDQSNMMQYYSKFAFTPPIAINGYEPMVAIIWGQNFGFVHGPLAVGKHTLTLDVVNTQPAPPNFGMPYVEYHNTWHISVAPAKK